MIEKTDKNKLIESGLLTEDDRFEIWMQHGYTKRGPGLNEITHVSPNPDSKTYTGIDAQRKIYLQNPNGLTFPHNNFDLMVEYYFLAFEEFFNIYSNKGVQGSSKDKGQAEALFIKRQIEFVKKGIEANENSPKQFHREAFRESENIRLIELGRYLKWLENKPIETDRQQKNKIAMELIGLTGGYNKHNTIQPVFYYVKDVLKKYTLSPIEAKEIVNDYKGSVSPEWNKNVVPHIIGYLKEISALPVELNTQQNDKFNNYDKTLFATAKAYQLFDTLINRKPKTRYKDYCVFIIRQMVKDKLMLDVKIQLYRAFVSANYNIDLDKFKSLATITTDQRKELYKAVKAGVQ